MDWMGKIENEHTKEGEMSSLAAGFVARKRKLAAGSEDETTPKSYGKRLKRSSQNEEA